MRALLALGLAGAVIADLRISRWDWDPYLTGPASRSIVLGVLWSVVAATAMLTMAGRIELGRIPSDRAALLFLGWAGVSSLAGLDPLPSVGAWLGLTAMWLGTRAIVSSSPRLALGALTVGAGVVTAASLISQGIHHGWTVSGLTAGRLRGVLEEPNVAGHIAGLFVVAGLILLAQLRHVIPRPLALTLALGIASLGATVAYLSDTRTVLIALPVAAMIAAAQRLPAGLFIGLVSVSGLGALAVGRDRLESSLRRSSGEDLGALSGRDELWSASIDLIQARPLAGSGLAAADIHFSGAAYDLGVSVFNPSSHNLLLEIARELGIVGLGLAAMWFLAARPWARRDLRPLLGYLAITALTMPSTALPGLIVVAWFVVLCPDQTALAQSAVVSGRDGSLAHSLKDPS